MATKITTFDFELWAEADTSLQQDLSIRPPKNISKFAEELAESSRWTNWDALTRELSGPVRRLTPEEYLSLKK